MRIKIDPDVNTIKSIDDIFAELEQARKLYFAGEFDDAYKLIIPVCDFFDMGAVIHLTGPNLDKKQYQFAYMLAGDICGELGRYDESLKFYIKHHLFSLQIHHDYRDVDSVRLYQFRNTRGYTLNNLRTNNITLVDPKIQNDIVDSPIYSWLKYNSGLNAKYKNHLKPFSDSFNFLRATSFCCDRDETRAIENTLMWAHYANCHKGICIEYELDKSDFSSNILSKGFLTRLLKIKYSNPNESPLDFTNPETKINARTAFAQKSNDWLYENEVRMIAYDANATSKFSQYELKTKNPIKAIYFGGRCSTQRINAIRQIFKDRPEVNFYQMAINPQNIHRLLYEPC